jgi:ferredoxin
MYVTANRDTCGGCGLCTVAAPEVFGQDDECVVTILLPRPGPELLPRVREAARQCPTGSIGTAGDHAEKGLR